MIKFWFYFNGAAKEPEKTFSEVYSPMLPAKETPDADTLKEFGFSTPIPELIQKKKWDEIKKMSSQLKESDYSVYDVFDWDNGGKKLANRWFKVSSKSHYSVDEYVSATYFILQARGIVMLPYDF